MSAFAIPASLREELFMNVSCHMSLQRREAVLRPGRKRLPGPRAARRERRRLRLGDARVPGAGQEPRLPVPRPRAQAELHNQGVAKVQEEPAVRAPFPRRSEISPAEQLDRGVGHDESRVSRGCRSHRGRHVALYLGVVLEEAQVSFQNFPSHFFWKLTSWNVHFFILRSYFKKKR